MATSKSRVRTADTQHAAHLHKGNLRAGFILWLRDSVKGNEVELRLLLAAGLEEGALNHPVVVIDALEDDPSRVLICLVTSLRGNNIKESRVKERDWSLYLPIHPNPSHPPLNIKPLCLKKKASMRKNSYIDTRNIYPTSLILLEKYDRKAEVSSYCLTSKSLKIVQAACESRLLHFHRGIKLPAMIDTESNFLYGTIAPSSSSQQSQQTLGERSMAEDALHSARCGSENQRSLPVSAVSRSQRWGTQVPAIPPVSQTMPLYDHQSPTITGHALARNPLQHEQFATEQQPLLPAPATSRSNPWRDRWTWARQPQWPMQPYTAEIYHPGVPRTPKTSHCWTLLRTLVTCVELCMSIAILILLPYIVYLGLGWLVRTIIAGLTATKANLIAAWEPSAGFAQTLARPFMAIGKGIAANGRSVVDWMKAVVRRVR